MSDKDKDKKDDPVGSPEPDIPAATGANVTDGEGGGGFERP